uniref:Endonuclease V n=1 Tax=candidate division WOR-3 bacterium TaxID=2052148 RepID=A0A7C3YQX5_UNCW3
MVEISELIKEQEELRGKVELKNRFGKLELIGGADCAQDERYLYCAFTVFTFPDLVPIEVKTSRTEIDFPYIPGFLSYREKRAYLLTYERLEKKPDVILFDGQGISHPRRFGLACHIGILLNKPTIGCAKTRLIGEFTVPPKKRGSFSPLLVEGEVLGYVVRTKDNVAPLFVSPGHKIDLLTAKDVVLKTATRYRLPEPLRLAHIISKSLKER